MKIAKTKLSKVTESTYILAKENNQYSIICVEESRKDNLTQIYKVPSITASKALATKIFKLIVKKKVYGVTLIDVIYNLIE